MTLTSKWIIALSAVLYAAVVSGIAGYILFTENQWSGRDIPRAAAEMFIIQAICTAAIVGGAEAVAWALS